MGHVVSTFSSQKSFSDLQTSPRPKSVSSVSKLDLSLPPEGDTCLASLIPNCPEVDELTVKCDSKGEGNVCTWVKSLIVNYKGLQIRTKVPGANPLQLDV